MAECQDDPNLFVVNGLTGVTECAPKKKVFYAPAEVRVIVSPVNLYSYSYKISKDEKELAAQYSVVGGGTAAADALKVSVSKALLTPMSSDRPHVTYGDDFLDKLIDDLDSKWKEANEYHDGEKIPSMIVDKVDMERGYKWKDSLIREFSTKIAYIFGVNQKLSDYKSWLEKQSAERKDKDTAKIAQNRMQEKISFSISVYQRWASVVKNYPLAHIDFPVVIRGGSNLHTISINRTYVATIKDDGTVNQNVDPVDENKIPLATVVFESHSTSYLNFSLGYAGYFRSVNSYQSVLSQDSDGNKKAVIEEKSDSRIDIKPHVMIGVYFFGQVDELDATRGPRAMLTMGMEVAKDPGEYSLGVAVDFPQGFVIGAGGVYFKNKKLAGEYSIGDEIPMDKDGKPIFTDIPVREIDGFAPYITLTFRPSIIQSFLKLMQ
ncbi:MAG: hypothetical protein OEV92_03740 [Nitrospinota bacterium]|nr:hypothetical protein [Nitrospinota bacterium]